MSEQKLAEAEAVLRELRSLRNRAYDMWRGQDIYYSGATAADILKAVNEQFREARDRVAILKGETVRRQDTNWRDTALSDWHARHEFDMPAAGVRLPMVEYDRGRPVAVISYQPRGFRLAGDRPTLRLSLAHISLGSLRNEDGKELPFFTVVYDMRNWAYRMLPHNDAALTFLGLGFRDWVTVTERHFVGLLYRLRRRVMPDLTPYGIQFADAPWLAAEPDPDATVDEPWPGQLMSQRRRDFEPVHQVRMSWRNPCVDVDFLVIDERGHPSLVVDYKSYGARIGLDSTNLKALSSLYWGWPGHEKRWDTMNVPVMVVSYSPGFEMFQVHCANSAARNLLAYATGSIGADSAMASVVGGAEWVSLSEAQWAGVLKAAAYR